MSKAKIIGGGVACLCLMLASVRAAGPVPAFPGAEGAGALTPGGRGGRVIYVTSLEDSGPGTFREAVNAKGPRFVLFKISGNIELKSKLTIKEPYLTIAGQTTPGGVCVKGHCVKINTHDVIVRHMRFRPGDILKEEVDGLSVDGQNVIIDHCSVSWGIDETLSVTGDSANVTVQWCIISESLNDSVHKKGPHGYGSLINGKGDITFHHNLYAFHRSRNPRPGDGRLDFRNNVIYGWLDRAGYSGDNVLEMNYVGNYLIPGPFSKDKKHAFLIGGVKQKLYIAENEFAGRPESKTDNWLLIRPPDGMSIEQSRAELRSDAQFTFSRVTTHSVQLAYDSVIHDGGAMPWRRDAVNSRIVRLLATKGGRIIDSQDEVGGWPELSEPHSVKDDDGDGMADDWERMRDLNPNDPQDASRDPDGDGYMTLEDYLGWISLPDPPLEQGIE